MADNGVREPVYADIELTVLCKFLFSRAIVVLGENCRRQTRVSRNEWKEKAFLFFCYIDSCTSFSSHEYVEEPKRKLK